MTILPGVISYPIPAYSNVPIEPQFYRPKQFFISAITLGFETIITTTVDNDYVIGQQVRLIIPPSFGSISLNEQTGFVVAIPASNQVTLNINSTNVDPFILSTATTRAQILAIGDANNGQINLNGPKNTLTFIPGSFINISPV